MTRMFKRSLLVLVVVGVLLVAAVAFLWSPLLTLALQDQLRQLRDSGSRFGWKGAAVHGLQIGAEGFNIWIPIPVNRMPLPVNLEFQNLSFQPLVFDFIRGNGPSLQFAAEAYGGSISGSALSVMKNARLKAEIKDLDLGLHPQLQALGLRSALVNLSIDGVSKGPQELPDGELVVKVSKIDLPAFPANVTMFPLPPIKDGAISFRLLAEPMQMTLSDLNGSCDHGSITGRIRVNAPTQNQRGNMDGDLNVTLTDTGAKLVGQWLPVISNGVLTATTKSFRIRLTGVACQSSRGGPPEFRMSGMCVRPRFES